LALSFNTAISPLVVTDDALRNRNRAVKMFIVAGLLDAVAFVGIGFALFFTFANPFLVPLTTAAQ
jgi:hypothetical protein